MGIVFVLIPLSLLLVGCATSGANPGPAVTPAPTDAATPAAAEAPIFPPKASSIGSATMRPDGAIVVTSPHQIFEVPKSDAKYGEWLALIGGLKVGEEKNAPPWPDPFDAAKVDLSVREYLTRKGIDRRGCTGDINGTDHDGNVSAWVACGDTRLTLRIAHDTYGVTEIPGGR